MTISKSKKGWHTPPKYIEPTTKGTCPYCKKKVDALEAHIRSKHKNEKLPKKK